MDTNASRAGGRRSRMWLALRNVMTVGLAAAAGLAVLLATARVTAQPAGFVSAGLAGFISLAAAGIWLLTRRVAEGRARLRMISLIGAVAIGVPTFVFTALVPPTEPSAVQSVAGQQVWHLQTGSQLAYVRVPAIGSPRPTPIIFLHGGPGTPDMPSDRSYFGQLAADGFDVYIYDQLGSGRSSRLADPRGYTVARDVTDLEQIQAAIGARKVVLIGHSYGAQLAAAYLAAHPDRVDRVVFSSPGSLDPADTSGGNLTSRLPLGTRMRLYGRLMWPRNLLPYLLLQVNPNAAHRFAGDAEMDARNDRVYATSEPALHCADSPPHTPVPTGMGFYRLQYPQSAPAPPEPDVRPALTHIDTLALVIKGSCDYQSWSSATSYLQTLPNARLVYLHGGHNTYQDDPEQYLATVRAFLTGRQLPVMPWRGPSIPPDFQGPA